MRYNLLAIDFLPPAQLGRLLNQASGCTQLTRTGCFCILAGLQAQLLGHTGTWSGDRREHSKFAANFLNLIVAVWPQPLNP